MADTVYLFDKAPGVSSFQALRPIKRLSGTRKVGHTGTLDRFASGLMVVLTGRLTRLNQLFLGLDKGYEATLLFGTETDTLDPEGTAVRSATVPLKESLEEVLPHFRGEIAQYPPAYSAVHVGGVRAHRAARAGKSVEMPERRVSVHELTLCEWEPPRARFSVTCSKGTYVRSLARDIAVAAGSAAYVESLRRVSIGPYSVNEAATEERLPTSPTPNLRELLSRLPDLTCIEASEEGIRRMRHGAPVTAAWFTGADALRGTVAVFDSRDRLVAVLDSSEAGIRYRLVVPQSRETA